MISASLGINSFLGGGGRVCEEDWDRVVAVVLKMRSSIEFHLVGTSWIMFCS